MPDARCLQPVMVALFGVMILGILSAQAPSVDRDERLFELMGRGALPVSQDGGFELRLRIQTTSLLTQAEVTAQLAEVRGRPEHPARQRLQRHAQLLAKPAENDITVWWSDWTHMSILEGGSDPGVSSEFQITTTTNGDTRWLLGDMGSGGGQLTIVHSGIPFPSGYDLSPNLGRFRFIIAFVVGGLWIDQPASELELVRTESAGVIHDAFFEMSDGVRSMRVKYIEGDSGSLRFVDVNWLAKGRLRPQVQEVSLARHIWNDAVGRAIPTQVHIFNYDSSEKMSVEVVGLEWISKERVQQRLAIPDAGDLRPGITVLDFDGSPDERTAMYENRPRVTWSHDAGDDQIDYSEVLSRGNAGATPSSKKSSLWARLGAATLAVAVLGFGVFVVVRARARG